MHNKFVKQIIGIGIAATLIFASVSALAYDVVDDNTVTESEKFTTTDTKYSYDFKKTLDVGGKEFNLTDTKYDVLSETPIQEDKHITKNVDVDKLNGDTGYKVGGEEGQTSKIDYEGNTYDGKLEKVEYSHTTQSDRTATAKYDQVFTKCTEKPTPDEEKTVSVDDPDLGTKKEGAIKLSSFTQGTSYWTENEKPLYITFHGYDNPTFTFNGKSIPKNEAGVIDSSYYNDLLASVNMNQEEFKITSVAWNGSSYTNGGDICRDAVAQLQKKCCDYTAHYEGNVALDNITEYTAHLTYGTTIKVDTDKKSYYVEGVATYTKPAETEPISTAQIITYISIGVVAAAVIVVLTLFLLSRRKKNQS